MFAAVAGVMYEELLCAGAAATSSQARSREMWVTAVKTSGIPGQGLGSL